MIWSVTLNIYYIQYTDTEFEQRQFKRIYMIVHVLSEERLKIRQIHYLRNIQKYYLRINHYYRL